MPLHLNAIMTERAQNAFMTWLLESVNEYDVLTASEDKRILLLTRYMREAGSERAIGKYVTTELIDSERKVLELIDLDITLLNDTAVPIRFLKRLPMSSDANEYYDASTKESEQHFQLETVNRHTVLFEVEGSVQNVYLSAFPFKLSLHDNMDALNASLGLAGERRIGNTAYKVRGLSDTFLAPGGAVNPDVKEDETFSFVIGTVRSHRDVSIRSNTGTIRFSILWLDTALGLLPTAASPSVFNLSGLAVGKAVAMCADIKADFVYMDYPKQNTARDTV